MNNYETVEILSNLCDLNWDHKKETKFTFMKPNQKEDMFFLNGFTAFDLFK